jgi:hypothetical protein
MFSLILEHAADHFGCGRAPFLVIQQTWDKKLSVQQELNTLRKEQKFPFTTPNPPTDSDWMIRGDEEILHRFWHITKHTVNNF